MAYRREIWQQTLHNNVRLSQHSSAFEGLTYAKQTKLGLLRPCGRQRPQAAARCGGRELVTKCDKNEAAARKFVNCRGDGERGRNRTFNLLIKSQLLCQLSYAPSPCCSLDSGTGVIFSPVRHPSARF
jgi:hypothetical protein